MRNRYGEELLWHVLWKRWREYRDIVYREFKVNNIEQFINLVVKNEVDYVQFVEFLRRIVKPSIADYVEFVGIKDKGLRIISFIHDHYPRELLRMNRITEYIYPPIILYHIGYLQNLNESPAIAVVGTRRCTEEGYRLAMEIGELLAKKKLLLVTGFAKGIDLGATEGALNYGGRVVEVRPWMDYDTINYGRDLVAKVLKNGCFIAENYCKKEGLSWIKMQFQLRNRIISGMSKAVIIVEARPKGGSMHQIEYAIKRGKPVLIWKPNSKSKEIYEAYRIYRKEGAIVFNDIYELEGKLEGILRNHYGESYGGKLYL